MLKQIGLLLLAVCLLAGCAKPPTYKHDPYETFNRSVFRFNTQIDTLVFKPLASVYDAVLPNPVKKGVANAFDNIGEVPTVANDLLQAKIQYAFADTCRFLINSTIGIAGLFDMAKHVGLPPHYEDLGLTFARWGAKDSPYLVLPFLGPSTVRDAVALPVNYEFLTVYPYIRSEKLRYGILAVRFVSLRAQLLPADPLVKESFDPYVFVRSAYLQRREKLMQDDSKEEQQDTYVEE